MTVQVEREDMSVQELHQRAGRVKDGRVSRRFLAIALVLEGTSRKVAAENCGMDRQTLHDWVHRYNAEGVEGLGNRRRDGVELRLTSDQLAQLATWVEDGSDPERDGVVRWRRVDLARPIEVVFGIKLHERTVGRYPARLGFRRMSVRPEHPKADPQAQAAFKENFVGQVAEALPDRAKGNPLEIWFQDEARVGQQGTLTRIWAKRGMRPRAPRDTNGAISLGRPVRNAEQPQG